MKSPFLILSVGAAAALFLVRPAEAVVKQLALCDLYADAAVLLAETGEKCNFSGPLWSRNRTDHFFKCMALPQETRDKFTDLRFRAVVACIKLVIQEPDSASTHPQAPDAAACEKYALTAEKQQAENIGKKCGYEGSAWHSDRQRHMKWCRSVDNGKVDSVTDARKEILNLCMIMRRIQPADAAP